MILLLVGAVVLLYLLDTHYTCRGGASAYVDTCGIFFITLNPPYSTGNWVYGAALSFMLCTHYPSHGGASDVGTRCGAFYVFTNAAASNSSWYLGAAL